jgi:hypothetical protein
LEWGRREGWHGVETCGRVETVEWALEQRGEINLERLALNAAAGKNWEVCGGGGRGEWRVERGERKGEERREKGEGRREKGEGRRERRTEKGGWRMEGLSRLNLP